MEGEGERLPSGSHKRVAPCNETYNQPTGKVAHSYTHIHGNLVCQMAKLEGGGHEYFGLLDY